ncbi:helix-turn-helix transcriptional regulator [Spirosoma agri]|uniref:Helix-turn-helix transcriptional regulator n=1 Tax=Spirosoma agri TaxID=1987381 RepID=A0A6M0IF82_9BACT|nr:AraC family transcriptional regulator [Spirosoma agri]NEU66919.1 helix-turn-helix transcriptional regulator [Spirosoma agri]
MEKFTAKLYPDPFLCRQIIQAKRFIDTNYGSPLRLTDIAGEAFFSPFHFIRLFRKFYGRTPHQYLIEVRIKQAKRLLLTDKKVQEVCFLVGFDSPSSFTGLFRKMTGLTPSEFSANQK